MNSRGVKEVKIFLNTKIHFEVFSIHYNRKKLVNFFSSKFRMPTWVEGEGVQSSWSKIQLFLILFF